MANKNIYKGMTVMPEDADIETYILQNPDKLFLLVTSSCLPEKKKGSYRLMLTYKTKPKLLMKDVENVNNANECVLLGILETVNKITSPNFEIVVINCIGTGMHRYAQNKEVANVALIEQILDKLEEKQCYISELIFKSKANEIKAIINATYPLSKNKKNSNRMQSLDIKEYTKELIQKTRKETYAQIIKNMVEMRFAPNNIASILKISEKDVETLLHYKQ